MKLSLTGPGAHVSICHGVDMPVLGLGLFQTEKHDLYRVVSAALEAGCRLFDTAKYYQNEEALGEAIRGSGINRDEIFIITKLWMEDMEAHRTREAVLEALARMKLDYLDLMLIHWPANGMRAAWKELSRLKKEGVLRSIGVSNFLPGHLEILEKEGGETPSVNQIEFHPKKVRSELRHLCEQKGILPQAYGPFMQGELLKEPVVLELAEHYGKTPAQILIRWDLQHGVPTIPKTSDPERCVKNLQVFDFDLSEADMNRLDQLDQNAGSLPEPPPAQSLVG